MVTNCGVLTVRAAGERVALRAVDVAEIMRLPLLTRVPRAPASLLGLANFRGAVLPVLSLAQLIDGGAETPSTSARIVVMSRGKPYGLLVDEVAALTQMSETTLIDLDALLARAFGTGSRRLSATRDADANAALHVAASAPVDDLVALVAFSVAGQDYAFFWIRRRRCWRCPMTSPLRSLRTRRL